jgi:putative ABC transport system permease protein
MIRHYFASAFAHITRTPFTSAANILTLALGFASFLAAYGITTYWRSADSHHAHAAQTVVVGESVSAAAQDRSDTLNAISSPALADPLREDFPELTFIARTLRSPEIGVLANDRKMLVDAVYAEPDFLRIFDLQFLAGDPRTALDRPGGVVLTQAVAERLFGEANALGRSVRIDGAWDGVVTGVMTPVRQPSFMGDSAEAPLSFEILASWRSHPRLQQIERQRWLALWGHTFVTLPPLLSLEAFNARLPGFVARRAPAEQRQAADIKLEAFPVAKLSTHDLDNQLFAQGGAQLTAVAALLGLGLLTLVIASMNYANLAAADAVARVKETGMRRIAGATHWHLLAQAWLEATLSATAALILALLVIALLNPTIHALTGMDLLPFIFREPSIFAVIAGLLVMVALAAGIYPAASQMRARPVEALRSGRSLSGPRLTTQILVGLQFAAASFLLILVTVTQLQRGHLERIALGPRQDPVVVLNDLTRLDLSYDTLAERLAQLPGVEAVSVVDKPLLGGRGVNFVQFTHSAAAGANAPTGYFKAVGHDYFSVVSLDVLAGRVFDRERDSAPVDLFAPNAASAPNVVIDRAYAERLGFESPGDAVGQTIYVPATFTQAFNQAAQPATIIGVTETEPTLLERSDAEGSIYTYTPKAQWGGQYPVVRIDADQTATAIDAITATWDQLAPATPINLQFFDQLFERSFRTYARVGQLFVLLAGAAFLIASIGLLGIAVHAASRRRHEIGVRKVLGASAARIVRLLLIDFSRPALLGNLAAWPLGYLAAQTYLAAFADRIDLTAGPFLFGMLITLGIACAAVSGVVIKAASARPASVLRHA